MLGNLGCFTDYPHFVELESNWRVVKSSLIIPSLRHLNPPHSLPFYFFKIHLNIIHQSTPMTSSRLRPLVFPTKILCAFCSFPTLATCFTHHPSYVC